MNTPQNHAKTTLSPFPFSGRGASGILRVGNDPPQLGQGIFCVRDRSAVILSASLLRLTSLRSASMSPA